MPQFHRNIAGEFMGLVQGAYDSTAKGFTPGVASLHNRPPSHGPDARAFDKASTKPLGPEHIANGMAFMFETRVPLRLTRHGLEASELQPDYCQ